MKTICTLFTFFVVSCFSYCAFAADLHIAASPSYADVCAAVAAAASGDTILVPAGYATWNSQLSINKGLTLRGAGIGLTVITSGIKDRYSTFLISYSPSNPALNEAFELTGFTFDGNSTSGILTISSNSSTLALTNITVHNNRFANGSARAINLAGKEFGVFYENRFEYNYISVSVMFAGNSGWNYPLTQGGVNYPFFEDNTFEGSRGGFVVETGQGGRIVFRYNTINNYGGSSAEVFDAHGTQGSRGTVSAEFYNNTVNLTTASRFVFHRGGKMLLFNNKVTGNKGYFNITEYSSWSYCTAQGYPKDDQINTSYYWNNIGISGIISPSYICSSPNECTSVSGLPCSPRQYDDMFVQSGRDYWIPITGLDVNKPTTCTDNTFYGATDTGKLYKCYPTDVWTLHYSPYPYPHSLRHTTALTAPENLRINPQ